MLTLLPGAAQSVNTGKVVQPGVTVNSPFTGFSNQAPATAGGSLVAGGPTANQFLIVIPIATTPFIKADLYDSNTRKLTALTISSALAEVLYSANNTMAECSIGYSSGQTKWYIKGANTAVHKVYPLSLSGTTLTVGTAIDISATYAASKADEVAMTSDLTDLWFIDLSGNNGARKYTLPATGFGAAQTAPTNTGYYQATSSVTYNHHFFYSNAKLYLLSSGADKGPVAVFQEFNIAGNSWTDKGVPAALSSEMCSLVEPIVDPASNTNIYFYLPYRADANTNSVPEPMVVRYTLASNTSEIYCHLSASPWGGNLTTAPTDHIAGNGSGINNFSRAGAMSVANGDMVFVWQTTTTAGDIHNVGTKWGRVTAWNYTGSGVLKGIACHSQITAGSSSAAGFELNMPVSAIITVDGDSTDRISCLHSSQPYETINGLNISFSTSIRVEFVGGWHSAISNTLMRPTAIARGIILS